MTDTPFIIFGFGRSGTTWLSDIISKSLGGLILFEPFHPYVYREAKEQCYRPDIEIIKIQNFLNDIFSTTPTNPWLIRNHLKEPLEKTTIDFINYVWQNSKILGFKTIRLNHSLGSISNSLNAKSIYIHRHPLSVLSSIYKRKNFWKEFTWSWHYQQFLSRSLSTNHFNEKDLNVIRNIESNLNADVERIILMWCISFIICNREIEKCNGYRLSYERLYKDPYKETNELFQFFNLDNYSLHPSYFFTPSMTTLRTVHDHFDVHTITDDSLDQLFWKNEISDDLSVKLFSLIHNVLSIASASHSLAKAHNYLPSHH